MRTARFSPFNLLPAWEQRICGDVAHPLVYEDTAYLLCEHNYVFAFAQDAVGAFQLRWRHEITEARCTAMEPLNNGVVIGTDDGVYLLDELTGNKVWKCDLKSKGPKSGAWLAPSPSHVAYVPPLILVLNYYGLYTLDAKTGDEQGFISPWREWKHIVADDCRIYLASKDGTVEAILPSQPWPVWECECSYGLKVSPTLGADALYCVSHDGYLRMLNKQTGQPLGVAKLGVRAEEPVLVGMNTIYIVTDQGQLRALDLDYLKAAFSCEEAIEVPPEVWLWIFEEPKGRLRSPLLFDDSIFVAAENGLVYGLDAKMGEVFWQNDLGVDGQLGLCRVNDTLIAAAPGKVVGFCSPPGFGRKPYKIQKQTESSAPESHSLIEDYAVTRVNTPAPAGIALTLPDPKLPRVMWSRSLPAAAATEIKVALPNSFVACDDNTVYAICADDSSIVWQFEIKGKIQGQLQVMSRRVCVNTEDHIYCFDAVAGHCLWQYYSRNKIHLSALLTDGFVFYACAGERLGCLDSANGRQLWEAPTGEQSSTLMCSNGEHLFFGTSQGVHAFRVTEGCESWFTPTMGSVISPLAYGNECVLAGCRDMRLYALHARSGKLQWAFKMKDEIHYAPVVSLAGLIYAASHDQFIYSLDSASGKLRWQFNLGDLPSSKPCLTNDSVYIGTRGGFILSLDASSGDLRWKHDLSGGGLRSGPVVVEPYLFAATQKGRLLCLRLQHK